MYKILCHMLLVETFPPLSLSRTRKLALLKLAQPVTLPFFFLVVSMLSSKYYFSKLSISESSGVVKETILLEILLSFVVECV